MRKHTNTSFVAGALAAVLVLVSLLAGCPADASPGVAVRSIILSGQIHTLNQDIGEYVNFYGDREVFDYAPLVDSTFRISRLGGEGSIDGGRLSFSIGTPLDMVRVRYLFPGYHDMYSNFEISPANARGVILYGLTTVDYGLIGWLERLSIDLDIDEDGETFIRDEVFYIYVDRNVTITGKGRTFEGVGTTSINIGLETGWNVIHIRNEATRTEDAFSEIFSMTAADPDWVRWVLQEVEDDILDTRTSPLMRRPGMP